MIRISGFLLHFKCFCGSGGCGKPSCWGRLSAQSDFVMVATSLSLLAASGEVVIDAKCAPNCVCPVAVCVQCQRLMMAFMCNYVRFVYPNGLLGYVMPLSWQPIFGHCCFFVHMWKMWSALDIQVRSVRVCVCGGGHM